MLIQGCQKLAEVPSNKPSSNRTIQEEMCLSSDKVMSTKAIEDKAYNLLDPFDKLNQTNFSSLSIAKKQEILDKTVCEVEKSFNHITKSIRADKSYDRESQNLVINTYREQAAPFIQLYYLRGLNRDPQKSFGIDNEFEKAELNDFLQMKQVKLTYQE